MMKQKRTVVKGEEKLNDLNEEFALPGFSQEYDDTDNYDETFESNNENSAVWNDSEVQYSPYGNDPTWDFFRRTN